MSACEKGEPNRGAAVLYIDFEGHAAPLTQTYHATASRLLSSRIENRGRPSTLTEVDSAYCPQCLQFYDAATASSASMKGRCPRPHCRWCPCCGAVLSVRLMKNAEGQHQAFYRCGYCRWTSVDCGVVGPLEGENLDKEVVALATDLLDVAAEEIIAITGAEPAQAQLMDVWETKAKEEERRRRNDSSSMGVRRGVSVAEDDGPDGWSVESLEAQLLEKHAVLFPPHSSVKDAVSRITLEDVEELELEDDGDAVATSSDVLAQQSVISAGAVMSDAGSDGSPHPILLPIPMILRPRRSRRDRSELAAGRTGILIKTKANPLEGDTSLRSAHGQWWKKDSSSVHVVPDVGVVRYGVVPPGADAAEGRTCYALLLLVHNPTLSAVRVRLNGTSSLELSDVEFAEDQDTFTMENVMMDGICRRYATSVVGSYSATKGMKPSQVVELAAVDLEVESRTSGNGGSGSVPEEVAHWSPSVVKYTSSASVQTVAKHDDDVWMELVLNVDSKVVQEYHAAPLLLEVEVGNGSWDSTLISSKSTGPENPDFVGLGLVILWKPEESR